MTRPDGCYLTVTETARALDVHRDTLRRWRGNGGGPEFIESGGRVFYSEDEIEHFAAVLDDGDIVVDEKVEEEQLARLAMSELHMPFSLALWQIQKRSEYAPPYDLSPANGQNADITRLM